MSEHHTNPEPQALDEAKSHAPTIGCHGAALFSEFAALDAAVKGCRDLDLRHLSVDPVEPRFPLRMYSRQP